MRSVSVRLADLNKVTIPIGFVGENLHTQVRIDCVKLFEEYPNAVPTLTVNPPMGDTYPAIVTRDVDYVIWEVEDSDLIYNGNGEIQLTFSVDEVVAKSYISRIRIDKSLVPTGEVPTPIENWIDEANEKLAEVEQWNNVTAEATTLEPGESATAEITEENGHNKFVFGIPEGEKGEPGDPGFSPVIVVTDITGGHRVSITDVGGTQTIDIMDGEKGDTGNGIASAVLNQDYTLTLNFTDGTHYTTPSIRGAKGETGNTGNGIASVTLNQDYTLTITYTNGQSTTTASIRGEKGETGATPVIAIGTVTTLQPGSDATATMDTTDPEHPVLSFGIPEGEPGEVTEAELSAVADSKADVITDTASGAIASFPDGANGMPVKRLVVNVDPVQDLHGQESPYPAGGGKNLFDPNSTLTDWSWPNGTISEREQAKTVKLNVTPGQQFTLSNKNDASNNNILLIAYFSSTDELVSRTVVSSAVKSVTAIAGANAAYMLAGFYTWSEADEAQLELGSTATAYAPYENKCPISGWTSTDVTRTGELLSGNDLTVLNGYINSTGSYQTSSAGSKSVMAFVKAGSVKITKRASSTFRIGLFSAIPKNATASTSFEDLGSSVTEYTINIPTDCYLVAFVVNSSSSGDISATAQIIDSVKYYTSINTYTYTFPQSAGTVYGGTLTIHQDGTGTLVVDKIYEDLGNYQWNYYSSSGVTPYFSADISNAIAIGGETEGNCTIYKHEFISATNSTNYAWWIISNGAALRIRDTRYSDAASFKNAVTGEKIVYPLATTVPYQLTNQQVVSLLKGQNNVWADCGNISMEYPADTKLYIDGKMAEIQALILENISNS